MPAYLSLLWSHGHAGPPEFIFLVSHSHKRRTWSLALWKCHCTLACGIAFSHQSDLIIRPGKANIIALPSHTDLWFRVVWEGRQTNALRGYYLKRQIKKEVRNSHRFASVSFSKWNTTFIIFSPKIETAAEYLNQPNSKANVSGNKVNLDLKLPTFRQTSSGGKRLTFIWRIS